jgi:amidase
MLKFEEYARHDATGLAELIRRRDVSVDEVRAAAFEAIGRINPRLNAVLASLEAESARALAAGLPAGPFQGVPFAIKELVLHAANVPCRMGSRLGEGVSFPHDTELMRRFRQAGLLLVATTQTPELGYCATTETVAFGPVHNPWRAGVSPGGSSGGSGAAVAAGIVPVAHANDGGGSIRIPAACNGLVGLKPTRDRIPTGPDAADPLFGHAIEFALTRSVRDCATLLDAVAGPDTGAPHALANPAEPFAVSARKPPGMLRIAVVSETPFGKGLHTEAAAALDGTRRLLGDLGHTVVDGRLATSWEAFVAAADTIWCAVTAAAVAGLERQTGRRASPDTLEAVTWACLETGRRASALDVLNALAYFNALSREVGAYFESIDMLVTPTMAAPPTPHGTIAQNAAGVDSRTWTQLTFERFPFTPLFNATGQPALSLPLHWSADGLPMGVQFVGRFGAEATLLALATQLESARPWASRLPAGAAAR